MPRALILAAWIGGVAQAQHDVGNPGDPVRLLVTEARDDARVLVIRVKPERLVIDPATPRAVDIKRWYTENYERYQAALADARLEWPPDLTMPHCALAVMREMTIYFAYPTCRETVKGPVDALKLMLHEGTHLAGNPDEDIADGVALAVYETWLNSDANNTPRWDSLNPNDAPMERSAQASVLFEDKDGRQKLFVWGGCNENDLVALECGTFVGDGAIYDLDGKTWEPVPAPVLPAGRALEGARAFATAVYTGEKILVFGGCSGADHICRDDYASILAFDLATRQWSVGDVPRAGEGPEGRFRHHAFWTGTHMLIYGGIADVATAGRGRSLADGWLYDPSTGRWTAIASAGAPSARRYATAVLADKKLIVYGGCDKQVGQLCPTYYKDGGIYDLATGTWTAIQSGSFAGRAFHTAVWTGRQMFVWGGQSRTATLADGALFTPDPAGGPGSWTIVASLASDARYGASAVWASDRVLVWGGQRRVNEFASGVKEFYLPTATTPFGRWLEPVVPSAPVGRWQHGHHWTGRALMVWGGQSEDRSYLNSGGLYVPRFEPREAVDVLP